MYPKGCNITEKNNVYTLYGIIIHSTTMGLSSFVKEKRRLTKLTQEDLAEKAGVGLRFVRELEQGKATLRIDKVNQVLQLFGCELSPTPVDRNKLLSNEKSGSSD